MASLLFMDWETQSNSDLPVTGTLRRRKQNAAERAEQDALVHLYSQALGMASPADAETGDE